MSKKIETIEYKIIKKVVLALIRICDETGIILIEEVYKSGLGGLAPGCVSMSI